MTTATATLRQLDHYSNLMRRRKAGDKRADDVLAGYCESYQQATGFVPASYRAAVLHWADFTR